MDTQEAQLVQAVEIASNAASVQDPGLVSQALAYLEELKQSTPQSWGVGWAMWTARTDDGARPKYDHAPRLFGLNLVDDFVDKRLHETPGADEALRYLQDSALAYLDSEFVRGDGESGVAFMKNKLAQTLSWLVLQTYSLSSSYTFLASLLDMCTAHADDAAGLNVLATDLVLRVLHDLSLNLGSDVTLRSVRSKERLQRDAIVRDEIRAHHAARIAEMLWRVLQESLVALASESTDPSPQRLTVHTAGALATIAMAVVGDYASWIDISLVVTMDTVRVLYSALDSGHDALRYATADTLCEIVSKGMKPADKLALIQGLDLESVLLQLEASSRGQGDAATELREHLAKLVNAVVTELCKIAEDTTGAEPATRDAAHQSLLTFLPLALAFLSDEFDEPTEQVLPSLHLVLGLYKKHKRQQEALGMTLSSAQNEFIAQLITLVLRKFKFDADAEWENSSLVGGPADGDVDEPEEDDEQLVKFYELRKQLQVLLGAIAAIDEALVSTTIHALIANTLATSAPNELPWEQAEVCLYAAFSCGEILSSVRGNKVGLGPHSFVQVPAEPGKPRNVRLALSVYQSQPPNTLGEILQQLFRSQIGAHTHPVVQLQYFETVVRYATSFVLWPDMLPGVLEAFLGERGLRQLHLGMRRRINYLFYRFVKDTRTAIPSEFVPKLLESMQDVLAVQATLPAVGPDEDPLQRATEKASAFDSQLYLFDTCGLLMAQLGHMGDTQVLLFKTMTQPLSAQLQQSVHAFTADPSQLQSVLQVHHLFLAISTIAKGFPDYDPSRATTPPWIDEVKPLSEQIVQATTALNGFLIVREAARGAFARFVASAGPVVLPYIPTLVRALVHEVTEAELVDLLHFVNLLMHKYKENVRAVLDELFSVLVTRIFSFLNQGVHGTDDMVRRADTERAYFALINALLTAGLDGILVSESNQNQLETVLQSHVYYAENGEPMTQRAALGVLTRLVPLWGSYEGKGLPGFEQFLYETVLPLVFQVPAKPSFDTSDAQSQLVLAELSALLKALFLARGDEFLQYLTTVYLPGAQCPPALAMELAEKVQTQDAKALKRFLSTFIASSRGA